MVDISMCRDEQCLSRETCYRFMAVPSPGRQTYAAFDRSGAAYCDHYWAMEPTKTAEEFAAAVQQGMNQNTGVMRATAMVANAFPMEFQRTCWRLWQSWAAYRSTGLTWNGHTCAVIVSRMQKGGVAYDSDDYIERSGEDPAIVRLFVLTMGTFSRSDWIAALSKVDE
jgi:hypothetical protein